MDDFMTLVIGASRRHVRGHILRRNTDREPDYFYLKRGGKHP